MAIETETAGRLLPRVGLETLRRNWGWYMGLGVALLALGVFAMGYSAAMTAVTMLVIGWVLITGGVLQTVHAFWRKGWGGSFLDLATGILYFVVGFFVVANPAASAVTLTLLISMFLIVGGIFRGVNAAVIRHPNWGWMVLHGVVSFVLGVMIWQQWPVSGLWIIGLYVGIEMAFNGTSLVMLSIAARKLPTTAGPSRPGRRDESVRPGGREPLRA